MSIKNQEKLVNLNVGDVFEGKLLIDKLDFKVARNGKPFVSITLKDDTLDLSGNIWDTSEDNFNFKTGEVIYVYANISTYMNNKQLEIKNIEKLKEGDEDQNPYLFLKKAPMSEKEMQDEIKYFLNIISNGNKKYIKIIKYLFEKNDKRIQKEFFVHPAAKAVHHNFLGGLSYHTLRMLKIAEAMIDIYKILNPALLLTGTLIHDLAKIEELKGIVDTEYSVEGSLLGHISIADGWIVEASIALGYNQDKDEDIVLLRHLILAHHGKNEWGSPVVPKVPESAVLHAIDRLDAQMVQFEDIYEVSNEGEMTEKVFGLQTNTYKAKGNNHILD